MSMQYGKTLQILDVYRGYRDRGATHKELVEHGITPRMTKYYVKNGWVFAGVTKPQRYFHMDWELAAGAANPRIAAKRLKPQFVPIAAPTFHHPGAAPAPAPAVEVVSTRSGKGLLLVERPPNMSIATGRVHAPTQPDEIRYYALPETPRTADYVTGYEMLHKLVRKPPGAIGRLLGRQRHGFYERLTEALYLHVQLHHLQFSYTDYYPHAIPDLVLEVDGRPVSVHRDNCGTVSIYSESSTQQFPDEAAVRQFMEHIQQQVPHAPQAEAWSVDLIDVAKDIDIGREAFRFDRFYYPILLHYGDGSKWRIAIYNKFELKAMRYEARLAPRCRIAELERHVSHAVKAMHEALTMRTAGLGVCDYTYEAKFQGAYYYRAALPR